MSYIEENLKKDEKILVVANFNKLAIISRVFWAIIWVVIGLLLKKGIEKILEIEELSDMPEFLGDIFLAIPIICYVIGGLILVLGTLNLLTCHLVVTNIRVIGKQGIFSSSVKDIPIHKVDSVSLDGSFFGRIFKYYSLVIATAGLATVGSESVPNGLSFPAISNANEVKNAITSALEAHADEARKAQARDIANAMQNSNNNK